MGAIPVLFFLLKKAVDPQNSGRQKMCGVMVEGTAHMRTGRY